MAAGLTGLTGLAGYQQQINADAQATPEQRSGNAADNRHEYVGEQAPPYLWNSQLVQTGGHGPYGPENQLLGDAEWVWQPGGEPRQDPDFDYTPNTHAAPWPKGILSGPTPSNGPDDIARQLQQSAKIHGSDTNGSGKLQHGPEALNDQWDGYWNVNPGHADDQAPPNLFKSAGFGWGTTDRTQSFARQNSHGFDSAHVRRRFAVGSIPGNNDWMKPGGRLLAKSLPGPARPAIGPDSPFAGQDLGLAYGVGGAVLLDAPSEYVAPPTPYLAQPPISDGSDAYVEWY